MEADEPGQTVVETREFASGAKRILSEVERIELIDAIAANPTMGDVIEGAGGARKLRWAAKGKGKSGGARVITFYSGKSLPVFLLAIFAKGEKVNLSKAERNELHAVLGELVSVYRERKVGP